VVVVVAVAVAVAAANVVHVVEMPRTVDVAALGYLDHN